MTKDKAHLIIQDLKRVQKELDKRPTRIEYEKSGKFSKHDIESCFGGFGKALDAAGIVKETVEIKKPKILLFDIETAPIIAHVWDVWEQNIALNQIKSDWHILSWAAKWIGDDKIHYMDQRKQKDIQNDKQLIKGIWDLLDEADIVITQNGKAFDQKKLNARFIMNGMQKPSSFRHIDVKLIAKKHFAFTSNRLEYMTDKLNVKYKKLKHEKFSGFELWRECLAGNIQAWKEMEKYNKYDVLALEELYEKLAPWDNSIDFNVYHDSENIICSCGGDRFIKNGYSHTNTGRFDRYRCSNCGRETKSKVNELSKEKKKSLRGAA